MDGETFYENLPAEKKAEAEERGYTKEKIVSAFDSMSRAAAAVVPVLQRFANAMRKLWEDALRTYPNRRVVYLALHGKPLVQKKNRNRIIKWMEKSFKEKKDES